MSLRDDMAERFDDTTIDVDGLLAELSGDYSPDSWEEMIEFLILVTVRQAARTERRLRRIEADIARARAAGVLG